MRLVAKLRRSGAMRILHMTVGIAIFDGQGLGAERLTLCYLRKRPKCESLRFKSVFDGRAQRGHRAATRRLPLEIRELDTHVVGEGSAELRSSRSGQDAPPGAACRLNVSRVAMQLVAVGLLLNTRLFYRTTLVTLTYPRKHFGSRVPHRSGSVS